jgi:hypothetical protein
MLPLAAAVLAASTQLFAPPPPAPAALFAWSGDGFVADAAFARRMAKVDAFETTLLLAGGESVLVRCEPFPVVAADIEVRMGLDGRAAPEIASAMRDLRQWRGEIVGEPGSLVHLAVSDRGAAGIVDRGAGLGRFALRQVEGDRAGLAAGLVRFDRSGGMSQPEVPFCGTTDEFAASGGVAGEGSGIPAGTMKLVDIAIDTDYEYFAIFGDARDAAEYAAALYGAVGAIYDRDVSTRVQLVYLRLFDDPDDLFNEQDPLGPFRDWWNENQGKVERDLAHLLTGRRNLPYGGVAWLNAACGSFGYAVNGYLIGRFADPFAPSPGNWDVIVTAHELGHNLGSLHTHSYGLDTCHQGTVQRGSIMSYCHINSGATANVDLHFHTVCVDAMRSYLAETPCVDLDCDGDGISDLDAIAQGLSLDVNGDGIPDECQDCDGDGMLDPIAIAKGLVADVNGNGIPDACEPDCNGNGVPDAWDIALGFSTDLFGNGIPDECEADCDGDGVSDLTNIQFDMSLDRSRDARIDACEDCDGDGVTDFEALQGSLSVWVGRADVAEVRELHPSSGVVMSIVPIEGGPAHDLVIAADGYLYASAGSSIVRVDRIARASLGVVATVDGVALRGIALGADGTLVAATSSGGVVTIDLAKGSVSTLLSAGALPDPRDVAARADGSFVVTCGDATVRRFNADGSGLAIFAAANLVIEDPVGVIETPEADRVLVLGRARRAIHAFDGATGAHLGRFDVQPGSLLNSAWGLAASGDGRAVVATGGTSSSTVNGYRWATGYLERTYRVYPADAPNATAIVVAPPSASDLNGNLIPDACEEPTGPTPDLNGDGAVDAADLAILLGAWGTAAADLNGDGTTDAADLAVLLGAWG